MRRGRRVISVVVFLALTAALLGLCGRVLIRKTLTGPWDSTNKIAGFYNEPEDEFEVMFFGGSHAYASFSPLELWHETGVKSYVFATQQQPLWATYYYILEALKTQSPAVIVAEVNGMTQEEDFAAPSAVHSYLDDLPFSRNKLALTGLSGRGTDRLEYLFPLIRYHSRWDELKAADFTYSRGGARDPYKGYVRLPETGFVPERYGTPGFDALLHQKSWDWLMRIAGLCRERGVELWLVKTPSNPEPGEQAVFSALGKALEREGLSLDDHNGLEAEIGLDPQKDYYDRRHLNEIGAKKYTDWFAARLAERYPGLETDPDDPAWAADYRELYG